MTSGRPEHRRDAGPGVFRGGAGFTLVELLVVIAVIAILASMLLPVLVKAKAKGLAATCLGQHRQLSIALHLYASEAEDRLPYNFGVSGTREAIASGRFDNWATSLLNWERDPENTNVAWLKAGGLGPFLSGGVQILRCPSDRVVSQRQREAGWTSRARSISLNAMVGNAGEFMKGYSNTNNPGFRQYLKLSDVPLPTEIFTFLDEHPDSVNDGYFLNRMEYREWMDLPASYHGGAASIDFADGHGESHRWRYARTRPPSRPDAAGLPVDIPEAERADFDWLMRRTTTATASSLANQN